MPACVGVKLKPVAMAVPPVGVVYQRTSVLSPPSLTLNARIVSPAHISTSPALCGAEIGLQLQSGAAMFRIVSQPAVFVATIVKGVFSGTLILKKPPPPLSVPSLIASITSASVVSDKK